MRLTGPVRAVVRALADARGSRLAVGQIARDARLSPTTVRAALATLGKARLVQHTLAPGADRQPPRTVYWLTGDGYKLAVAGRPEPVSGGLDGRGRR